MIQSIFKATAYCSLLFFLGCQSAKPRYFFKGKEVVPVLEWCDNNSCFQSVDPVVNGQPHEESRFVVEAKDLEVRPRPQ